MIKDFRKEYFNISSWLIPIGLAIFLISISFSNFILFHTLSELFAIIIAILMCVVAWQMYPFTKNNFLMYLGAGYFWIACLDLVHALSYKGLAIIPNVDPGMPIEFWIVNRFLEAILLASAPWFLNHQLNREKFFIFFGVGAVSVILIIIYTDIFPEVFIEGKGLTIFKVVSEYIIITILIAALIFLKKCDHLLEKRIVNVMVISILLTMFAELAFTFYVDVYGFSNLVGHIFKLFSFWLIFMAMVKTTLKEPFLVMSKSASTYDAIPDATIVVDENGIIRQANNVACDIAGIECDVLIGKDNHEVFHANNITVEHCPVCQAIVNNEELRGLEINVEDNTWYDFSLSHITGASNLDGTVEVIRDISQRKMTEFQINELDILKSSIVDNLPSVLFVKNAKDRHYVEWNRAAEELTGLLKEDIIGHTDFDFWPKEQAQFFIEKDDEVIKSGKLLDIEQEPLTTKQKGTRTLHTKKIPIYDQNGDTKYLLGISEDITEKLKTEEMLSRSQKMEVVGQMSGGIAHDFNNQLGVILGYTELLSELPLSEKHVKWLDAVRSAAERCSDLTQQLLIFSRRGEADKKVINVNSILSEMKEIIQRSITPEINVLYYLADDLWMTEVNSGACEDAILNLVLNARDAMPGGGNITIETSNMNLDGKAAAMLPNLESGDYIQIVINDTGHGMPQDVYKHVFEPFFTTKGVGNGTGLGLAMVYGFVRRYGGDIILDTKIDQGTTFKIYLPRSIEANVEPEKKSSKEKIYPAGHENILIVDDEPALLTFGEQVLSYWGYNVYCAKDADEAFAILEKTPIDLLFTDVVMPGSVNGYQLAEKASQLYSNLKVLITSGFAGKPDEIEKYEKLGFQLISKPYDRAELAATLRQLLDN